MWGRWWSLHGCWRDRHHAAARLRHEAILRALRDAFMVAAGGVAGGLCGVDGGHCTTGVSGAKVLLSFSMGEVWG